MPTTRERIQAMHNPSREVAKLIRTALRQRSGKSWSVTCGRGTAYGWLHIQAKAHESMTPEERAELATLLGLESVSGSESIPASTQYYVEYLDRAEGREPSEHGEPYWD